MNFHDKLVTTKLPRFPANKMEKALFHWRSESNERVERKREQSLAFRIQYFTRGGGGVGWGSGVRETNQTEFCIVKISDIP